MDEFFDEPRRCTHCNVVTYCDRCPLCGKLLARSKLSRFRTVAGEETLKQPKQSGMHHELLHKQRIFDHKIKNASQSKSKQDEHCDENVRSVPTWESDSRQKNKKSFHLPTQLKTVIGLGIALFIFIQIIFGLILFTEQSADNTWTPGGDDLYVYGSQYLPETHEMALDMENSGDRCIVTDVYLYDENNQVVSQFDQLLVLPHMQLTLTLDSKDESDLYEFKNTRAYEIDSTKPDFEYTSFTLDGETNVFVEDEISTDDLEILVRYLYEASQYGMGNLMKSCDVEILDGSAYEVVIEDGEATVTYLNEDKEAQFSYSFSAD